MSELKRALVVYTGYTLKENASILRKSGVSGWKEISQINLADITKLSHAYDMTPLDILEIINYARSKQID